MLKDITDPVRSDYDRIRTAAGRIARRGRSVISLSILSILLFFQALSATAGDEEMNPSAYQIFDPVTGYMIEVEQPPDELQSDHTIVAESWSATQDPDAASAAVATAAAGLQPPVTAAAETPSGPNAAVLAAGLALLVVVAVFTLRMRKHGPGQ